MAGWVGRKTERESESLEGGQRDRIAGFRSRTERDGKRQRKKEERESESEKVNSVSGRVVTLAKLKKINTLNSTL